MKANKLAENLKKFWENTAARNAHLGKDGEGADLMERARLFVGEKMSLKNKTVIDFGCGGGFLGKYLLENKPIKKYIAFDVATRSLSQAKENLKGFEDKTEFRQVIDHTWNFAELKPDVIVCLAVMIHFPTQLYLDNFIRTCENSGAKNLVLEIRNKGRGLVMQKEPYSADCFAASPKTCLTCETSPEYVAARLPSYNLVDKTNAERAPTNCQVLWFEKKRAKAEEKTEN